MDVGVHDTGHRHPALEVDHLGVRPGGGLHIVVRSNLDELAIPNGHGLCMGPVGIDGIDKAVAIDCVRLTCPILTRRGKQRQRNRYAGEF